jgi:hypothetical protein
MLNEGMRIIKWRFHCAFLQSYRINMLRGKVTKFPEYTLCPTSNVN